MEISKNKTKLGRLFSREMAVEYGLAGAGAILYTGLPTAFNMQGPGAMALGLGACLALGVWLESPTLLAGGLFVAVVHLIYKYGSNLTLSWWGRTIWSLDPSVPSTSGTMNDYVQYNPYNSGMHDAVNLPNGYQALALPPADQPAPMQGNSYPASGINDYVTGHEQLMDDGFLEHNRYEQNGSFESNSIFE
jgi:hypothetical protein